MMPSMCAPALYSSVYSSIHSSPDTVIIGLYNTPVYMSAHTHPYSTCIFLQHDCCTCQFTAARSNTILWKDPRSLSWSAEVLGGGRDFFLVGDLLHVRSQSSPVPAATSWIRVQFQHSNNSHQHVTAQPLICLNPTLLHSRYVKRRMARGPDMLCVVGQ